MLNSDGVLKKIRKMLEEDGKLLQPRKKLMFDAKIEFYLAQLRQAYAQLVAGGFKDQKEFAEGLLSPAIDYLETQYYKQYAERNHE